MDSQILELDTRLAEIVAQKISDGDLRFISDEVVPLIEQVFEGI